MLSTLITSQKTKLDHVVAMLAPEIATEVRDFILTPPMENPYDTFKAQLIKRTAASEQRHLQQLSNAEELEDCKPTQLLRRMQQLLGDKASSTNITFVRELFLQRLPTTVCVVLASTPNMTSLEDLAQLTDKIVEVAIPSLAAVHTPSPRSTEVE